MVYGTLADVKQRLGITTNTHDTQLGDNQTDAYAYINNQLDPFVTTPISAPQIIIEAENSIAAGFFIEERYKRTNAEPQKSTIRIRGEEKVQQYIDATYRPGSMTRSATGFSMVSGTNSWDQ